MYKETIKVKYSDLDRTLTASFAAMLRFFQNAAIDHTREVGFSLRNLYGKKNAWILISMNTEIYRYPEEAEEVLIKTYATSFERIFGKRSFSVTDKDGTEIARASTVWVFTDTVSGKPCRIDKSIVSAYGADYYEGLPYIRHEEGFIKGEASYTITATNRDTDTNSHVNNVRLAEFLQEAVPINSKIHKAKIFYHSSVRAGDTVSAFVHHRGNEYHVCIEDYEGKVMTAAQFEIEVKDENI